jgi:hypothetical protein
LELAGEGEAFDDAWGGGDALFLCPDADCLVTGRWFEGVVAAISSSDGTSSIAAVKTLREGGPVTGGAFFAGSCRGPLEGEP